MPSAHETDLLAWLGRMYNEGRRARDDEDLSNTDEWMRLAKGQQWPSNVPKGFVDFVLNLIGDVVQRKASLLTDARPVIQIISTNKQLVHQPRVIETLLRALYDDHAWQEALPKAIARAEISGSVVGVMSYSPTASYGRGELMPEILDARSVVVDPSVIEATHLPNAEYVFSESPRALASLVEEFGERAFDVQADADLSSVPEDSASTSEGIVSASFGYFRRRGRQRRLAPSAIPRAWLRHYWFKDFDRYPEEEPMAGQPMWSRPRIIRHVIAAGGAVLVDELNPFWHGGYPHEILDWGMNLESPWGHSEVKGLRKAQEALNRIASDILKNTILMNNFKVIGDKQALDPEEWDKLNNRPAILLQKRQGTELRFESPPALPGYLFQLIGWLQQAVEMQAGLSEVTRGGKPSGVTSGLAIEGLQLAAQTIIRLQARRIESWISRLWDKAISGIFQFYTTDRVRAIVGPGQDLDAFTFDHAALHLGIEDPREAFRDFVLHVQPGSSLTATKVQKAVLASNLFRMGLIDGESVLRAAEWPDPEGTLKKAKEEGGQHRGPVGNMGGRSRRNVTSFPAGGSG